MKYLPLLLILGGCATSSPTYGPDGKQAHSINCSGAARNWGMCLEKAGELCGSRGYSVVERSDQQGAVLTATQGGVFAGTTQYRVMLVSCK